MSEINIVPQNTAPLELLVRFAEALANLEPSEREVILRCLADIGAPKYIYQPSGIKADDVV